MKSITTFMNIHEMTIRTWKLCRQEVEQNLYTGKDIKGASLNYNLENSFK
jgi:hypothetical protein